ncbi:MAG: NADH-quinone oxidoreductase subunit J [Betaproteobacteria bacterium]
MEFKVFVFWVLATVLVGASLRVVTARNSVHAALYLVLAFFTAAGVWMLLQAEFLAIALVLVYVGAVMVLFLFVLMMLDLNFDKMREGFRSYLPLGFGVGILTVVQMSLVLWTKVNSAVPSSDPTTQPGYSNTISLGKLIYTEYVFAVEIAAVILLVAIVAAIALTLRRRKETKYQTPSQQIRVRREDRVRLLHMASSPRETRDE